MAIVQVYYDAVIHVLVNDTLPDYTTASCLSTIFLLLFHSVGLNYLAPQKLSENGHLYLNSHIGRYRYFHKTVVTYYKQVLFLGVLTQRELKLQS